MYGTQTEDIIRVLMGGFENDVKMYGTQTNTYKGNISYKFENDVKMYGTQTDDYNKLTYGSLRMM